jgi:hypothetical protein
MRKSRYSLLVLIVLIISGAIVLSLVNHRIVLSQAHHDGHRTEQVVQAIPTMPGQDAFGAIQEIVSILEADADTDWQQVNLMALREHLLDMNEVTLKASIAQREISNGLEMLITGTDRTQTAIQRLVPAQANQLNQLNGWQAVADRIPNGVRLTVTSSNPQQVERIQALGFIGLVVSGGHHQRHHLALAKGMSIHE